MSATGIILYGGLLDGREINTARELEQANANPRIGGRYVQTERRARDGRLVFAFVGTANLRGPKGHSGEPT